MVVRPQFRGMRIAHHLYKGLEDAARNAGLGMLSSRVSVHNVASVSALHRAGWSVYVQSPTTLRTIRKLTDDAVR
ncbi:GNAT family N-acetyltransferase [Loktanella sp. DJP18]|uniref:GNAT family N-acetyltransferase n=1 Tax=Loktanella sp. DJP18 TaxID=3409788 RepID=UPI003BB4FC00